VLSDVEIVAFWKAAEAERIEFAAALKLLLLTGCRAREIAELRWNEIVDWNIELPGARTKNHCDHIVPLSPLAREILAGVTGVGEYVFPTRGVPVELGTRLKDRLDAAMGVDDWVLHDLRRTAATGMAKLGIAPHIVEAVLNHVSGAKAGVAQQRNR
jgi:integrase